MGTQLFANNAATIVNGTIANGDTTINVASTTGSAFPAPSGGDYFIFTLYEKNGAGTSINFETVKCTTRATDAFQSCSRDFEGIVGVSGGRAYPSSVGTNPSQVVYCELRMTAAGANNMLKKDDNLLGVSSASTARTNLGLGSMATQASSAVTITGGSASALALTGATVNTAASVSAAGASQGAATAVTADLVIVTTVGSGTGVILPSAASGKTMIVVNKGANPLLVYPATSQYIDALAINTAISIPVSGWIEFCGASTTQWYSTVNAVTNAALATNGASLVHTTGTLSLAGNLATTGAFNWGITVPGAYTYTLPSATSTLLATNGSGSSLTFGTGALSLAGNWTVTGAFNSSHTIPGAYTYTYPSATSTLLATNGVGTALTFGGTSVISLAGNFTTTGAFAWGFTVPGAYTYTLPSATSTLLATNGSGSSLTFGTGSLSLAGALTTSGAFGTTLTATGTTALTLPTSGTLATTAQITGTNSGTNTGDNAANTTYASDYRAANFVAGTNYLAPSGSGSALTFGTGTLSLAGNWTVTGAFNSSHAIPGAYTYTYPSATSTLLATNGSGSSLTFGTGSLSLAGALTTSGAFGTTLTATGTTAVTLPTSGTLLSTAAAVTPAQGGTGVANNAASTITITGAFGTTLTVTGTTSVTLPTSGTLATTGTNTFSGAQIGGVTSLTSSAASIAINLANNNNFSHTTSENTTLAAPSNPVAGQSGAIVITQGGTARTLAYNAFWKFPGGTAPSLTATIGAVDTLVYYVESATRATCQLLKGVA